MEIESDCCKYFEFFCLVSSIKKNKITFSFPQRHPQNGGQQCPKRMLRLERCHVNCDNKMQKTEPAIEKSDSNTCTYSKWSAWSPCSKTCGDSAVQIRTRAVLNHPQPHLCTERLEERRCEVMPCLVENFNYN